MEHNSQIDGIMSSAMESLRDMVDVNTVIGDPVVSADGSTMIPVSRVCFGFVAGGGDLNKPNAKPDDQSNKPFAGGAAAGVSVQPVGFVVMGEGQVRVMPAQYYAPVDRIIEMAPQLIDDIRSWIADCKNSGK
ncbi:MAG: GerW family sporulation protein [Clostridia bacterium]|nr:GerW family sporulation protein [Clostridia bacterium]